MKRTLRTFDQKEIRTEEKFLGKTTSFTVKVIEGPEIPALRLLDYPSNEELRAVLHTDKPKDLITQDFTLMQTLKAENPKLYERCSMPSFLGTLITDFPSPKTFADGSYTGNLDHLKNLFAICTLRFEIDGKQFAMSRFLTWLYQDYKTDPVDRMAKCSTAIIIHQDTFLIEPTLQAISRMFAKVVEWNKATESLQELKNRVALLRFTYAHCMPNARGDGAIGDWLELALYRFHGFTKTRHNSELLPCFEPLVSLSLSHYFGRYDQTIAIE